MNCPACQYDNPDGAKFCMECGATLAQECSKCGTDLPEGAKFCVECGTPIAGAASKGARVPRDYTPKHLADKILQSKSVLEGERKQVTVLFADVKGSMDLANQLDPEEWHTILDRFFEILSDGVHKFEGTVNQYTGDGIMALFGAPIAHEDHSQRACYAALHLRDALKDYADGLRLSLGVDFSVRMGINSGDVVVGKIGDDLRMDYTAQGHTVGMAQRMESLAAAHSAYISQSTAKLVEGYVALRDLGETTVKGAENPVHVFELTGMGEMQTRFDVSRARGLSRFVGRAADMRVLDEALEQASLGNGQAVGVVAEAGTGKSRLCFEFAEQCRANGIQVLHGSGVAHGKNIPLLPIMQIFRSYFGISEQDDDRTVREKIAGRLLLLEDALRDTLPLLFDFMGVPDPERPPPSMDPDARQRQLFGVMRRVTQARADHENHTLVFLIEDLHWIDGASDAWVEQLVEAVPGSRTLLLVNFRPEYHAGWMQKSDYRQLPLLPLGPEAIQELLADMLGGDRSINGLATTIHGRTAGNPFFTEEVVQALIEAGNLEGSKGNYRLVTPIERLSVPTTVQSVLSARIDRLHEREKEVLQTASVIGKDFPEPILEIVINMATQELGVSLQALKDGEFIYQQSLYPVSEYTFKHPLTQEVALGSQLRERRQKVHAAVARALEERNPDKHDEMAALLAHHHEEADEMIEAVRWHRRAAEWLLSNDASEAQAHWRKVHDLSGALPATREAMEHTLKACDMLLSNGWRTGLGEEDGNRMAQEGQTLAERLGDKRGEYGIQLGLATMHVLNGYAKDGAGPCDRAIALADELDDLEERVVSRHVKINLHWMRGQFDEKIKQTELVTALVGRDESIGINRYNISVAIWVWGELAVAQIYSGNPAKAAEYFDKCITRARELGQTEVIALCTGLQVDQYVFTGIRDQALQQAQRSLEYAEQIGSPFTESNSYFAIGQAHLLLGQPEAAVAPFERVMHDASERRIFRCYFARLSASLADAYRGAGDVELARNTAEEGIRFAKRSQAIFQEALASLALVRALREIGVKQHADEIASLLDRSDECVQQSTGFALWPFVTEERARTASALGDVGSADKLQHEAHELFARFDATGHVERLAAELGI